MQSFKNFLTETKVSLEYHTTLNPVLWIDDKLKPEVRKVLLRFADTWAKFANIKSELIKDVIMTGGNANYNYTSKSDIDVHIVLVRNELGSNREQVDDILQDKKMLWTLSHNVRVLGYPLEPYAQDISEKYPAGQGVYSLKDDVWIQKPEHGNYNFSADPMLKRKVMYYVHLINTMIKNKMDINTFDILKKKLRDMRTAGIEKSGEFSRENLIFKELRNRGILDKMNAYQKSMKDKSLSLT